MFIQYRFYGFIKTETTGDLELMMYADDIADLYIDGEYQMTSILVDSYTTITASSDYHFINIDFVEYTLDAELFLYWGEPGGPYESIPSDNFYIPEYVSTGPFTVQISCASGYYGYPIYTDQCTSE